MCLNDFCVQLQNGHASVRVSKGAVGEFWNREEDCDLYPQVRSVRPVCIYSSDSSRGLAVTADNIESRARYAIHCRIKGSLPLGVETILVFAQVNLYQCM